MTEHPDAAGSRSRSALRRRHVPAGPRERTDITPRSRRPAMPPKRATVVAQQIVKLIRDDKLRTGDPLPPEHEMLEMYPVGRNTLREALRVLELQGVVTIRAGRGGGPVVAAPDSRHLASTLALLLQFAETPFRAVLETRSFVEPIVAQLCAERVTPELAEELRASVAAMAAGSDDEETFLEENQRFHELLSTGADNPLFSYFLNSLHWIIDGVALGVRYPKRYRQAVIDAHDRICAAVTKGDGVAAAEAMRDHMTDTFRYFERKYHHVLDTTLTWEMYGSGM
ncbi:FadR/GntR family transcriptional regulator [Amycolatopsis thermoflava]|uniref:FadR/GntR family transcriptional regulator n=1 Tax=Amycolatopsis thermoflava TaxID=84480 RepID=UPI003827F5A0